MCVAKLLGLWSANHASRSSTGQEACSCRCDTANLVARAFSQLARLCGWHWAVRLGRQLWHDPAHVEDTIRPSAQYLRLQKPLGWCSSAAILLFLRASLLELGCRATASTEPIAILSLTVSGRLRRLLGPADTGGLISRSEGLSRVASSACRGAKRKREQAVHPRAAPALCCSVNGQGSPKQEQRYTFQPQMSCDKAAHRACELPP
jgi:hypothetical protein